VPAAGWALTGRKTPEIGSRKRPKTKTGTKTGKPQTENRRRKTADGKPQTENCRRKAADGNRRKPQEAAGNRRKTADGKPPPETFRRTPENGKLKPKTAQNRNRKTPETWRAKVLRDLHVRVAPGGAQTSEGEKAEWADFLRAFFAKEDTGPVRRARQRGPAAVRKVPRLAASDLTTALDSQVEGVLGVDTGPSVLCIPVSLSCASSGSDFMCCFRVCAYGRCLIAAALSLVSLAWHSRWQVFCQCLQDVLGDFLLVVCRFVCTLKSQLCFSICLYVLGFHTVVFILLAVHIA
jgi:hypothetical protein